MARTLAELADAAGVSTATASRALRGRPGVSEPVRRRIQALAAETSFTANAAAASLASGKTATIAIVTPYIDRWFFTRLIASAQEIFQEVGFATLLYSVGTPSTRDRFFREMPVRHRTDAVLVASLKLLDEEREALLALGTPVVVIGPDDPGLPSVGPDDEHSAQMAVGHLIGLGHRRIGLIAGDGHATMVFTPPEARQRGYRQALAEAGIEVDESLVVPGEFTFDGGVTAMTTLLSRPPLPTAVFAMSDEMAMGALRAMTLTGLEAPRHISVIGFDDHDAADLIGLTTLSQDVAGQGRIAAQMVLEAISGSVSPPRRHNMAPRLVLRGTTGPVPSNSL